jgi:hypothetical protein
MATRPGNMTGELGAKEWTRIQVDIQTTVCVQVRSYIRSLTRGSMAVS